MKARGILPAALFLILQAFAAAQGVDLVSAAYGAVSSVIVPNEYPFAGESAFRILAINSGGIAEGMASAATALPVDSSVIPWNPASSALLENTELAVSHNSWIGDSKIEGASYAVRFGNLGLGIAGRWIYSGLTEYDDFGGALANGTYSEALILANASFNFFSGYYFGGVSLGASLKAALRGTPDYADESGTLIAGSGLDQSAMAIMGDFGLITRFNFFKLFASRSKNASLGITVRNVGPAIYGDPLPTTASIGLAYAPLKPLFITANYTQPINLVDFAASEWPSLSAGASFALIENLLSLHGGVLVGSTPRISAGATVTLADISLVANYSLDLLTQFKDGNRISIEARLNLGDGGRYVLRMKVEDLYIKGLREYSQDRPQEAIALWTAALKLDPGFDPARNSRRIAEKHLKGMKALEDLQFFDKPAEAAGEAGTEGAAPSGTAPSGAPGAPVSP